LKSEDADQQEKEVVAGGFGKTDYPTPIKNYNTLWEIYDLSLEEPYYWVYEELKNCCLNVVKLEDSFAAAENSSFFGITQVRLGGQQDKITQLLTAIGQMIKQLFQMVRELRILDERLGYYDEADGELKKDLSSRGKSAEITLKGYFVDLVQGSAKNPASVFGMARELEFVTLPDLFFDAPPFRTTGELQSHITNLEKDFNRNVTRVLQRHLRQFTEWRKRTHKEHRQRKTFQLAYLKQHFEIIQMYVNWIKPYLRNVSRLHMKEKNLLSPEIISAFESTMLDVEVMGYDPRAEVKVNGEKVTEVYDCLLATFNYRTRAEMKVVQEGYQRGPVHIGRVDFNLRIYRWTKEEVEGYKKLKQEEALILVGDLSGSIRAAMDTLGDELRKYLNEGENGSNGKETSGDSGPKTLMEKMFGNFYTSGKKAKGRKKKINAAAKARAIKDAKDPKNAKKFGLFHG
jgi:hypothetical protein